MPKNLEKSLISKDIGHRVRDMKQLWVNPDMQVAEPALAASDISMADVKATEARLQRFAPLLVSLFPKNSP